MSSSDPAPRPAPRKKITQKEGGSQPQQDASPDLVHEFLILFYNIA